MKLVDMRDLKFRPITGPGSTPGAGKISYVSYCAVAHLIFFLKNTIGLDFWIFHFFGLALTFFVFFKVMLR